MSESSVHLVKSIPTLGSTRTAPRRSWADMVSDSEGSEDGFGGSVWSSVPDSRPERVHSGDCCGDTSGHCSGSSTNDAAATEEAIAVQLALAKEIEVLEGQLEAAKTQLRERQERRLAEQREQQRRLEELRLQRQRELRSADDGLAALRERLTKAQVEHDRFVEDLKTTAEAHDNQVQELQRALASKTEEIRKEEAKADAAEKVKEEAAEVERLLHQGTEMEEKSVAITAKCEALRRSVEQEQTKLSVAKSAQGSRVQVLEAKVEKLQSELRSLQNGGADSEEGGGSESLSAKMSRLDATLASAQESNRQLVQDVRKARNLRDASEEALTTARANLEKVKAQADLGPVERTDLQEQVRDLEERVQTAREEADRLRAQSEALEEQAHLEEAAAKQARQRHIEVDEKKREWEANRKLIEESAQVYEWRFKKALAQLQRDHPERLARVKKSCQWKAAPASLRGSKD
mmetsp:Transcript_28622/g.62273  ORF Transcript_28622/g.62273 Transcript_28622/m.62273 type:complete len:463 (-) Transcript_28622:123-1511(-)